MISRKLISPRLRRKNDSHPRVKGTGDQRMVADSVRERLRDRSDHPPVERRNGKAGVITGPSDETPTSALRMPWSSRCLRFSHRQ
jgi:hypothetical protein